MLIGDPSFSEIYAQRQKFLTETDRCFQTFVRYNPLISSVYKTFLDSGDNTSGINVNEIRDYKPVSGTSSSSAPLLKALGYKPVSGTSSSSAPSLQAIGGEDEIVSGDSFSLFSLIKCWFFYKMI